MLGFQYPGAHSAMRCAMQTNLLMQTFICMIHTSNLQAHDSVLQWINLSKRTKLCDAVKRQQTGPSNVRSVHQIIRYLYCT